MIDSGPRFSLSCQRKAAAGAVEKKALVFSDTLCNPRKPLPSAPNPVPLQMVFSRMPYLSSQRGAATGWPMLLFPLPLAIRARTAPSEAEGAEREAGHIRRLSKFLTQFLCGYKERKANGPAHSAEDCRNRVAASEETPVFAARLRLAAGNIFSFHRPRRFSF